MVILGNRSFEHHGITSGGNEDVSAGHKAFAVKHPLTPAIVSTAIDISNV
jgi:hypothetical protein